MGSGGIYGLGMTALGYRGTGSNSSSPCMGGSIPPFVGTSLGAGPGTSPYILCLARAYSASLSSSVFRLASSPKVELALVFVPSLFAFRCMILKLCLGDGGFGAISLSRSEGLRVSVMSL